MSSVQTSSFWPRFSFLAVALSLASGCTKTDGDECAQASASSDCGAMASGGGMNASAAEQELGDLKGDERLEGQTLSGMRSQSYCFEATTNSVLHVAMTEPSPALTTRL